jgi:soluble lytic murein transglycosylase-like protein
VPNARDWTDAIARAVAEVWPEGSVALIRAQVQAESGGDPHAVSPAGAQGLLQLMPGTWTELGAGGDPFDPDENLRRGITYLRRQIDALRRRLPSVDECHWWGLAAYNGGPGYVQRALALARADGEPLWWHWRTGRYWLMHRLCQVGGRWPDYRQIWGYVGAIQRQLRG